MVTNSTIALAINIISIIYILGLSVLLFSTRKQYMSNAGLAIMIVCTPIPVYIYDALFIMRNLNTALWIAPFAYVAGIAFMPMLWIFIHNHLNPHLRFPHIRLLHFAPLVVCFVAFSLFIINLTHSERILLLLDRSTYTGGIIHYLNSSVIVINALTYFAIILIHLVHYKKATRKIFSKTECIRTKWIPTTLLIMSFLLVVSLIFHHSLKQNETWIFNIIDLVVMTYFTVHVMKYRDKSLYYALQSRAEDFDITQIVHQALTPEQAQQYSDIIVDYIKQSKCYLNPELDIDHIIDSVGLDYDDIDNAIHVCHNCTFYEFINKIRIERTIHVLETDVNHEQTLDSLTFQNGFSSQQIFRQAFKSHTGKYPSEWIREKEALKAKSAN